jgi:festuclavine dehydrogenase
VHAALIRDKNMIRSATHNGKIPWVSVGDVAAVAYHALVDEPAHNTEHFILGPELLSYGDVSGHFLANLQ